MKLDIIYIKLEQNSCVTHEKVQLQDVAEILSADSSLQKEIKQLILYTFQKGKEEKQIFSSLKVVQLIQKERPGAIVQIIGDTDFIVSHKKPGKPRKSLEYLKAAFVGFVLFFGAGFTIMTFNTDVSVGEVFSLFYKLVMGTEQTKGSILEITYNLGIAIGILGFYNHFSKRNERDDPTPLHVDMRTYEDEMNKTVITNASRENMERTI